jgi:hypothetical protein
MNTTRLSFDVSPSDAEAAISLQVYLNSILILDVDHVKQPIQFAHDISDEDGEHELKLVMGGKNQTHTVIDEHGNILKDANLIFSNFAFDTLELNYLVCSKMVYTHDFNGTQPMIDDIFHGIAGCNGTVSFRFTAPVYLWLLENM